MNERERVELLKSYGKGAYCSYISGHCAVGGDVQACAKRNPVECRSCRQKNEAKERT